MPFAGTNRRQTTSLRRSTPSSPRRSAFNFIFAIAAVEDPSTVDLLQRALDDSDEAVALAAARALAGGGRSDELERFFATHRGERATRLARTLELLS